MQDIITKLPSPLVASRKDQLFVRIKLDIPDTLRGMITEDVAQAIKTAILARANGHRCRVHAIVVQPHGIDSIIQFPASLPLNVLGRIVIDASEEAALRNLKIEGIELSRIAKLWTAAVCLETLNASAVSQAAVQICAAAGMLCAD